ncbi:thioredoxin domain-containing protein 16 [Protopterus annectens]|uniref:thioredoxin domain-containing protein 16 n=1 Tax=Protopterus annectens TaxID=7888 RepID=UPI001CF9F5AD|nr:thioredoxin domain-containing protein 16 [Protopterus annectens]
MIGSICGIILEKGSLMLIDFPTDILFDVNAIIAHVLFAVLYNEVTYTSSYGSLQNIENSAKGKNNVIFVYVRAIGIPEHRAVMETAFVYGAKYQFVLTTEDSMLKDIGAEDSSNLQGRLWVCHCKMVTVSSQPCRRSELGQPLTTVNIHMYLKLMEDPLVIEASTEPEKISSVYLQLQLPLVLVITQKETYALDKANAEEIAWRLLGSAGVALLSRDRPGGVNIPATANVGIRTAKEGIPIKYFTAQDFEDIIALAKNKLDLEQNREYLEVDEDSTEDFDLDFQDDEVAEAVHRDRKREFGLELVESLTDESFAASVIEKKHVVVLFYTSYDAVEIFTDHPVEEDTAISNWIILKEATRPMVNGSFVTARSSCFCILLYHIFSTSVITLLKINNRKTILLTIYMPPGRNLGILIARVDCGKWTDVCTKQNITQYPVVKLYLPQEDPLLYTGMLGSDALIKFIMLSLIPVPLQLTTLEEAKAFISLDRQRNMTLYSSASVLGLFTSKMSEARHAFLNASKMLKGYVITGIFSEQDASHLSEMYAVSLPALIVIRHWDYSTEVVPVTKHGIEDMTLTISSLVLEPFPEITVENFPTYFQLGKPLLMLFFDDDRGLIDRGELAELVKNKALLEYTACWLDLRSTPVGRVILKNYFHSIPRLPILVLINIHSGGEIFAFPLEKSVTSKAILDWLKEVKEGKDAPITTLPSEAWKPPLPAYDFLSMMDEADPTFAAQQIPNQLRMHKHPKEEKEDGPEHRPLRKSVKENIDEDTEEPYVMKSDLKGIDCRLASRAKHRKSHMEL